jgi:hypothetical protein
MEVKRRIKSRDSVHNLVVKSRKRELKEVKKTELRIKTRMINEGYLAYKYSFKNMVARGSWSSRVTTSAGRRIGWCLAGFTERGLVWEKGGQWASGFGKNRVVGPEQLVNFF